MSVRTDAFAEDTTMQPRWGIASHLDLQLLVRKYACISVCGLTQRPCSAWALTASYGFQCDMHVRSNGGRVQQVPEKNPPTIQVTSHATDLASLAFNNAAHVLVHHSVGIAIRPQNWNLRAHRGAPDHTRPT